MANVKKISMSDLAKNLTLTITLHGVGIWKSRVGLMIWLLRLAAWVGGVHIKIESELK